MAKPCSKNPTEVVQTPSSEDRATSDTVVLMIDHWHPCAAPLGAGPDTRHGVENQPPHPYPTSADAAVPGSPESKNSQAHHKPGCKESSLALSKRCEGMINLNNHCPHLAPCSGLPCTGLPHPHLPPCRAALHPACRGNPAS